MIKLDYVIFIQLIALYMINKKYKNVNKIHDKIKYNGCRYKIRDNLFLVLDVII